MTIGTPPGPCQVDSTRAGILSARDGMGTLDKPRVVVDPQPRRMEEIFSPDDLIRLHETVEVVWGQDHQLVGEAVGSQSG